MLHGCYVPMNSSRRFSAERIAVWQISGFGCRTQLMLDDFGPAISGGHHDVHKPYRIAILVGIGARDTRNGDDHIGSRSFDPTPCHRLRNLSADGRMPGKQLCGNAQGCGLVGCGVDDISAVQEIPGAGRLGEKVNECASRARLCRGQRQRPLFRHLHGAMRRCFQGFHREDLRCCGQERRSIARVPDKFPRHRRTPQDSRRTRWQARRLMTPSSSGAGRLV
jgi:hypothetical protein